jgi:hypothetical protein
MSMREIGAVSAISTVKKEPQQYYGKKKIVNADIPWRNDMMVNGICQCCNNNLRSQEFCLYCDGEGKSTVTKIKKFRMNFYKQKEAS